MARLPDYAAAAEVAARDGLGVPLLLLARGARRRPPGPGGREGGAAVRRALRGADRRGAGRPRGGGSSRGAPVPGAARRRRLGRPRPRPGRDRHGQPRRRLRHRPCRRHAALPLHGRRRRHGDADQPRDPGRGPRQQHPQAHPAVRGARLPAARLRAPAADPQRRRDQDEQAQEPDRGRRLRRPGLPARGARQLLRVPGLVAGDGGGRALARRDRRAVRPREGPEGRRPVRPRAARVAQRAVDPAAGRPATSSSGCCRSSRPRRSPGRSTGSPSEDEVRALLPFVRERLPTLAAIVDVVGFLWVDDLRGRSGATRPEALGRRRRPRTASRPPARRLSARSRDHLGGRRAGAAAARARRGPRLEGRRPVHGDPRRDDRAARDAAPVRHARGPGSRADAGPARRSRRPRDARRGEPAHGRERDVNRPCRRCGADGPHDPRRGRRDHPPGNPRRRARARGLPGHPRRRRSRGPRSCSDRSTRTSSSST